jgi:hypothetical protein
VGTIAHALNNLAIIIIVLQVNSIVLFTLAAIKCPRSRIFLQIVPIVTGNFPIVFTSFVQGAV